MYNSIYCKSIYLRYILSFFYSIGTVEPGYSEPGCTENLAIPKRPDGYYTHVFYPGYSEIIAIVKGSVGFMHFTIARFDCRYSFYI